MLSWSDLIQDNWGARTKEKRVSQACWACVCCIRTYAAKSTNQSNLFICFHLGGYDASSAKFVQTYGKACFFACFNGKYCALWSGLCKFERKFINFVM